MNPNTPSSFPVSLILRRLVLYLSVSFLECLSLEFSALSSFEAVFRRSPAAWLADLGLIMLMNLVVTVILRKAGIALPLMALIFACWSIANYYTILFHGSPAYPSELENAGTAAQVAGSYHYPISVEVVLAACLFAIEILIILFFLWRRKKPDWGRVKRWQVRLAGLIISLVVAGAAYMSAPGAYQAQMPWHDAVTRFGFMICSLEDITNKADPIAMPEGYSAEALDASPAAGADVAGGSGEAAASEEARPDIIFILNETFFDLDAYTDLQADADALADYRNIPGAVYGCAACAGVGGGTNNSEFELLMSGSMHLLKVAAPFTYLNDNQVSRNVVSYLKALGYQTVGMHAGTAANYNRDKAYPAMGFDKIFLGPDAFQYTGSNGARPWLDSENYKDMIDRYEALGEGPRMMYLMTYQNHGGYEQNDASLDTVHAGQMYGDASDDVDEFLSSVQLSASAFRELTEYFAASDRDVIICMAGDHAPPFIQNMAAREGNPVSDIGISRRLVPYVIWSNRDLTPDSYTDYAALTDLAPMVLKAAGLPLSSYYKEILDLHEILPIRTSDGKYVDRDLQTGQLGEDAAIDELMQRYYYMEYNMLQEDCREALFGLPHE